MALTLKHLPWLSMKHLLWLLFSVYTFTQMDPVKATIFGFFLGWVVFRFIPWAYRQLQDRDDY